MLFEFTLIVIFILVTYTMCIYSVETANKAKRKHKRMMLRLRCTEYKPQTAHGERAFSYVKQDRHDLYDAKQIADIMERLHSEKVQRAIALQRMLRYILRHQCAKRINTVISRILRCSRIKRLGFMLHTEIKETIKTIRIKEDIFIYET